MEKFNKLAEMIEKEGNKRANSVIAVARELILGLNHVFRSRDVYEMAVATYIRLFTQSTIVQNAIKDHPAPGHILFLMEVWHVVRHSWELTDEHGVHKTGNDLHMAYPLLFEDDETLPLEELFDSTKRSLLSR